MCPCLLGKSSTKGGFSNGICGIKLPASARTNPGWSIKLPANARTSDKPRDSPADSTSRLLKGLTSCSRVTNSFRSWGKMLQHALRCQEKSEKYPIFLKQRNIQSDSSNPKPLCQGGPYWPMINWWLDLQTCWFYHHCHCSSHLRESITMQHLR